MTLLSASEWQGRDRNWDLSVPRACTVSTVFMAFIWSVMIHWRQHMGFIMGREESRRCHLHPPSSHRSLFSLLCIEILLLKDQFVNHVLYASHQIKVQPLAWSPWLRGLRNWFGSRNEKDYASIHPPSEQYGIPMACSWKNTAVTNWQNTCFCFEGLFSLGHREFKKKKNKKNATQSLKPDQCYMKIHTSTFFWGAGRPGGAGCPFPGDSRWLMWSWATQGTLSSTVFPPCSVAPRT